MAVSEGWRRLALAAAIALVACGARAATPDEDYRAGEKAYYTGELNEEAVRYYRMAAEQGNVEGEFGLGEMLLAGEGVKADRAEALRWLTRAAELGHVPAMQAKRRGS